MRESVGVVAARVPMAGESPAIGRVVLSCDGETVTHILIQAHAAAGSLSARFHPQRIRDLVNASLFPRWSGCPAFFIARRAGGVAVGCVAVAPSFCSAVGWELGYLAVVPEAQGGGVGRALVDEAVAFVLAQAPSPSFLLARAARPGLFEAAGFRRVEGADADAPALMLLSL